MCVFYKWQGAEFKGHWHAILICNLLISCGILDHAVLSGIYFQIRNFKLTIRVTAVVRCWPECISEWGLSEMGTCRGRKDGCRFIDDITDTRTDWLIYGIGVLCTEIHCIRETAAHAGFQSIKMTQILWSDALEKRKDINYWEKLTHVCCNHLYGDGYLDALVYYYWEMGHQCCDLYWKTHSLQWKKPIHRCSNVYCVKENRALIALVFEKWWYCSLVMRL